MDSLNRCGVACVSIEQDLMPTEEQGNIGHVKPIGWHTVKYDYVNGKYLYNCCHLIGYQLTAENATTRNLITGTRYMNMEGMLPFENMVADYIKETDNHVMYRVSPIFEGNNLVANGVLMEGYSVKDSGDDICYCVYVYNAQPGIHIDYATGDSYEEEVAASEEEPEVTTPPPADTSSDTSGTRYILNTNTMKFHYPSCSSVKQMSPENTAEYVGNREDLINQGYSPCKKCNP